jgi:hypothetical protein
MYVPDFGRVGGGRAGRGTSQSVESDDTGHKSLMRNVKDVLYDYDQGAIGSYSSAYSGSSSGSGSGPGCGSAST